MQAVAPDYLPLGQILIDRGLIRAASFHSLLEWTNARPKLGDILRSHSGITEDQLERALAEAGRDGLPLGETLVQDGLPLRGRHAAVLCLQMNVPFLDLDRVQVDPSLVRLINKNYATRHLVVPVSQVGQTLTVAMNDPSDLERAEERRAPRVRHPRRHVHAEGDPQGADAALRTQRRRGAGDDRGSRGRGPGHDPAVEREYSPQSRRADEIVRHVLAMAISRGASDVHMEPLARTRSTCASASTACCARWTSARCSRPATRTSPRSCRA